MEVSEGFIVGVYNYCDRWCERCRLTSRCRLFADRVEDQFERDHGAIGEPRQERQAREIARHAERWERELGIDFAEIQREAIEQVEKMTEEEKDEMFDVRLEHLELETRAKDLCFAIFEWLKRFSADQYRADRNLEVVSHFGFFVPGKVYRALMGLKDDDTLDEQSDARGSAKAALLGLEELLAACNALAAAGCMEPEVYADFTARIVWVIRTLDALLPSARSFVRPGLDESDEVARLDADSA
jgi:hypothetical protein